MKVGDLVRYSRQAPPEVQGHLGLVLEAKDWEHPATSNVRVNWFNQQGRATWHHTLVLEIVSENR